MLHSNRLLGAIGWDAVMLGLAGCADQDAPGDRLRLEPSPLVRSNGPWGLLRAVSR
ncbi:hypothetical protein WMF18_25850 [Sorangium sp. So ce315]|uniref:hypothetical protein n=1 Tax=Sorangium sp. So ce315 TaxID=3133299 RepID=UPI003F5D8315